MTKFKVGDKFIPRKPKYLWNYDRHWKERMERYWDRTMTVDELHLISEDRIYPVSEGTSFNADWCEKVEERFPDIGKTIDWEQRRYEIARDFMAAQINGVYVGNLEWSYEGEAKSAIEAADELIKQLQSS